jgi:hypothetical protein
MTPVVHRADLLSVGAAFDLSKTDRMLLDR